MRFQFPKFHKKDLVITIHGFGRKTEHEMDPLASYLEKQGFEVWTFSYYDPEDLSDTDFRSWILRCEARLRKAVDEKRRIHLLGFSMGGVVASYLASVYPVEDLLLAAPAFYPIDFNKIQKAARGKMMSSGDNKDPRSMSSDQTKAFLNVVSRYRGSILQVDCPILMLHGTADEVISFKSSRRMFEQIENPNKYLVFLESAHHRFLYDGAYESLAFPIIRDYFRGEIKPQIYNPASKEKAARPKAQPAMQQEPARPSSDLSSKETSRDSLAQKPKAKKTERASFQALRKLSTRSIPSSAQDDKETDQ